MVRTLIFVQPTKTDLDVIRENHRFLWDDDDEPTDWEQRLAKKYYSKLFREYCICDLTRYKDNKIAMRWRCEEEVLSGKGQFICGSKGCSEEDLRSWEVNFTYAEDGTKKSALVKLRLCVRCSDQLNYHSTKRLVKKQKRLHGSHKPASSKQGSSGKKAPQQEQEPTECNPTRNDPEKPLPDQNQWLSQGRLLKSSLSIHALKHPTIPGAVAEERSREDEFSAYLEDLLM